VLLVDQLSEGTVLLGKSEQSLLHALTFETQAISLQLVDDVDKHIFRNLQLRQDVIIVVLH